MTVHSHREPPQTPFIGETHAEQLVIQADRLIRSGDLSQPILPGARSLASVMEQTQPPGHLSAAEHGSESFGQRSRPPQVIRKIVPPAQLIRAMRP
jgi:hypothetical protein